MWSTSPLHYSTTNTRTLHENKKRRGDGEKKRDPYPSFSHSHSGTLLSCLPGNVKRFLWHFLSPSISLFQSFYASRFLSAVRALVFPVELREFRGERDSQTPLSFSVCWQWFMAACRDVLLFTERQSCFTGALLSTRLCVCVFVCVAELQSFLCEWQEFPPLQHSTVLKESNFRELEQHSMNGILLFHKYCMASFTINTEFLKRRKQIVLTWTLRPVQCRVQWNMSEVVACPFVTSMFSFYLRKYIKFELLGISYKSHLIHTSCLIPQILNPC